jgi:cell pole-organizing protein PopZ
MENHDGSSGEVSRTFAGMLSELEDVATRLTVRQAALAKELAEVDEELRRIEAVRAAMTGRNAYRPSSASREGRKRASQAARVEKITEWARERGGEFTGREAAQVLGMSHQGVGPIMAGMVRRGEATARDDTASGQRFYSVA